jgi:uncharacterized membrane protein YczE
MKRWIYYLPAIALALAGFAAFTAVLLGYDPSCACPQGASCSCPAEVGPGSGVLSIFLLVMAAIVASITFLVLRSLGTNAPTQPSKG